MYITRQQWFTFFLSFFFFLSFLPSSLEDSLVESEEESWTNGRRIIDTHQNHVLSFISYKYKTSAETTSPFSSYLSSFSCPFSCPSFSCPSFSSFSNVNEGGFLSAFQGDQDSQNLSAAISPCHLHYQKKRRMKRRSWPSGDDIRWSDRIA